MSRIRTALVAAVLIVCVLFQSGCSAETEPAEVSLSAESTETTVLLRWDAVDGADRYRLFRKGVSESDFRFVCDVTDGTSYTDKYVVQDVEYVYKLRVYAGSAEVARGECLPVSLSGSPGITAVRQVEGGEYEVEWNNNSQECVVYGKNSSGWCELGRSKDGCLRFANTQNCTELSVSSTASDAIRSDAVAFCGAGSVCAVTPLDAWTNAVEFDVPDGDWRFELARSETKDGVYTTVGSTDGRVIYDGKEENALPYWYRFRCLGERFESAWSEPVQAGTNARTVFYVPVMMYHEFLPEEEIDETIDFAEDVVTPAEFESDLLWLKEHGYTTITTAALAAYLENGAALPEKPVIISIDDGKYSVYKQAWPLLMKHGMTASLAVIGSMIDAATEAPRARTVVAGSYCTWDEIGEMYASGAMEITSHTQEMHVFRHNGRQGADVPAGETAEQYLSSATADAKRILSKIKQATGSTTVAMAYPYSLRSEESDRMWLAVGYKLLLCGNNDEVHKSKWNPMIREAGLNGTSALLRRIGRVSGTSIGKYLGNYEDFLAQNGK